MTKRKDRRGQPLFCAKCGRIVYNDSPDRQWWLVGTGNNDVVRCPQHITEWTMRLAGIGRSQSTYRWKRLAKEQDTYDYRSMVYEPMYLLDDI